LVVEAAGTSAAAVGFDGLGQVGVLYHGLEVLGGWRLPPRERSLYTIIEVFLVGLNRPAILSAAEPVAATPAE